MVVVPPNNRSIGYWNRTPQINSLGFINPGLTLNYTYIYRKPSCKYVTKLAIYAPPFVIASVFARHCNPSEAGKV